MSYTIIKYQMLSFQNSLQLHKTHCNGGEFFVFNPLQTLFKPPSTPLKPHQISPDLGLKWEFSGIYEVKLANCVAMDFYEIGVFGIEKKPPRPISQRFFKSFNL